MKTRENCCFHYDYFDWSIFFSAEQSVEEAATADSTECYAAPQTGLWQSKKLVQPVFVPNSINLNTLLVGKKNPGWKNFNLWAMQLSMAVLLELWLSQLREPSAEVFRAVPRNSRVIISCQGVNGNEPSMETSADQEKAPWGLLPVKDSLKSPACV